MLSESSWFRITAGQKDYAGRMQQMEQSRNEHYAALGMPPGPPTSKGIWGEPETTGQALTNKPLGNYDIPDNWPRPQVKNPPGDVPGPPVQYGPPVNPDQVEPGYGFSQPLPLREDDIYFYHTDHLGSTSYITDADANPTQFVCYLPFGQAFVDEHTTRPEMPYKFNGKEQDGETGLYYYGARYYDAVEGRFYGIDRFAEKYYYLTPYQYADNNPISNIDFQGDSIIKVTVNDKSGYIKGESTLYIDHTIFDDTKSILEYAVTNEVPIHLNSSFRTNKKQGGLTSANSTTPAAKSKSAHNAGLALDFNLYKNDQISDGIDAGNSTVTKDHKFIKEVKGKNWRWGGDFTSPDKIHMDKRGTDTNFETIRDANQIQMEEIIKRMSMRL